MFTSFHSTSGEKLDGASAPLVGAHVGTGQNLLLSPASLQLAQLQAQLTLHRLKLAQTTNTAAAATVLNQVLSNVAMSQPLFNHLRGNNGPQTHSAAFPPPPIPFPPPNTALGQLVGAGFTQNPAGIGPTNFSGISNQKSSQHNDFTKNAATYSTDVDCRFNFGYPGGTSVISTKANDGVQYSEASTQPRNNVHTNFQRQFYPSEAPVQQTGFMGGTANQILGSVSSTASKEHWKGQNNFGKIDIGAGANSGGWAPPGLAFGGPRAELYNPEEPTADQKFNSTCGPGIGPSIAQQGGFQQQPHVSQGEEGVTLTLQPHQFNDYHGTTPSHLPHQCTICEKKVYNLKDWDQHVKGKLHLQNCSLYTESPALGAVHFPVSSEGCLNMALNNSMAYTSAASQDVSTGSASYLPAAAMASFPVSGAGFNSHQSGTKFVEHKVGPGRVVHICNLPEGSCTENDVINLGLPFGKVTNYILMRSTHQITSDTFYCLHKAFLEMAYVEAAQAMVQFYQLQPAAINGQKLLIRMSKRYRELQLKKPGKDVETIIQDIHSQKERDEMQEIDRYQAERARSRSPVSRSLSPHSHSPSFASCSSAHSPPGAPWSNGMGPRRPSWDWTPHSRGEDEPRERDDWRNEEDERLNGWVSERRKPFLKPGERNSPRTGPGDERGRDWYPRGSPQGASFSSYHTNDDFYKRDSPYRNEKLRSQHQRHDGKSKRREGGDYHRSRHSESDIMEETSASRTNEERGRSKRTSRRPEREEKEQREDHKPKERSVSPHNSKPVLSSTCNDDCDRRAHESGDDGEEESWYPKSFEELVTVDEVGGEDDSIIEPDLPDLQEEDSQRVVSCQLRTASPKPETRIATQDEGVARDCLTPPSQDTKEISECTQMGIVPENTVSQLHLFPCQEFKSALEDTSSFKEGDLNTVADTTEQSSPCEREKAADSWNGEKKATENTEPSLSQKKGIPDSLPAPSPQPSDISAAFPSLEQEKVISEHSIPLGVEFIVPRTGFYCNLCGLFYTSEQTAKTSHCRSTIHYRNLQSSLVSITPLSYWAESETSTTEKSGLELGLLTLRDNAEAGNLSDSFPSGDEDGPLTGNVANEINGNWKSAPTGTLHEARLKAKLKRRLRKNSSRDSGRGDSISDNGDVIRSVVAPTSPKSKLLNRRSRTGKGRGLPKKGGAGGKGVWGTPGEVYDEVEVDRKDPNYDAEQENCVYETVVLPLDEVTFEKTLTPIVQEYFEHGDANEVAELLAELNLGSMRSDVPMLAVSLALEARASHRELTSQLLSELCGRVLTAGDVEASFHKLLKDLPDLVLDTPAAPQMLGQFIARAVADEILPKSFIESYKGRVDCEYARAALDRAAVLLRMSRWTGLRIDCLWGSGGGQRPVNQLIKEARPHFLNFTASTIENYVNLLLKEYLLSGDTVEAERCLRELEVPHFHHEFVYEAVIMVLESRGERTLQMILQLLKSLSASIIITVDQLRRGFERVYLDIPDISIDVPCAYLLLEQFVEQSYNAGVINKKLRDLCPSRGRKRLMSEGDGGLATSEKH
ncbi:hypothetical protein DNTS_001433 [Danionella cerebrum]|uniref:Programmed cell death protein 4 n=1 Tax=Danionella cerebrum TaxID=2873325 RepID=A0A553R487_9TELE|nr:hypothetical protein DNTS_001433 [Danionella translucida]